MKSKLYPLILLLITTSFVSCSKWLPENKIIGTWKLVDYERRRGLSNETFVTGYEVGTFTFMENGSATYSDANRQMTGTWSMEKRNGGYSDGDGNWHSEPRTIFKVHVFNFIQNGMIDWNFDRIDFRSGGDKLFTYEDGLNYTYRWDFRKQ